MSPPSGVSGELQGSLLRKIQEIILLLLLLPAVLGGEESPSGGDLTHRGGGAVDEAAKRRVNRCEGSVRREGCPRRDDWREIRYKSPLRPLTRRTSPASFRREDGEPGNGGSDSSRESDAGCLLRHRPKRYPGPATDRRGGRPERGEELGAGELRREVSRFSTAVRGRCITQSCRFSFDTLHISVPIPPLPLLLRQV